MTRLPYSASSNKDQSAGTGGSRSTWYRLSLPRSYLWTAYRAIYCRLVNASFPQHFFPSSFAVLSYERIIIFPANHWNIADFEDVLV